MPSSQHEFKLGDKVFYIKEGENRKIRASVLSSFFDNSWNSRYVIRLDLNGKFLIVSGKDIEIIL